MCCSFLSWQRGLVSVERRAGREGKLRSSRRQVSVGCGCVFGWFGFFLCSSNKCRNIVLVLCFLSVICFCSPWLGFVGALFALRGIFGLQNLFFMHPPPAFCNACLPGSW